MDVMVVSLARGDTMRAIARMREAADREDRQPYA
jgi:hypothetical protein